MRCRVCAGAVTERLEIGVLDVARSVLAELDLEEVLHRVLGAARTLTEARYAALGVLNADGDELDRFLMLGIDDQGRREIGPLPRGRGVLGELIRRPAPLRLTDVGAHPHSYGFPPGHPPMTTFLGVPIVIDGRPYGNLYLTEKTGGAEFTEDDEKAVVLLAELAAMAIDHAERFGSSEQRRDELERTVATLDATTQITRAVGGQTDLALILELVAKRGRALISARAVLIELPQGGELVVAASAGDLPEDLVDRRLPLAGTVASAALRSGTTQRIEVDINRARFEQHGLGSLGVHAEAGLVVPLVFQGRPNGVLVALDRLERGPAFTADDQRLIEAFAASAATAVATARSVAEEHRHQRLAAAESERLRWARELHDETLQGLAAVRVGLSAARRSESAQALEREVDRILEQIDLDIANLRALISDLRPAALDELGTKAAVEALAERIGGGLAVDLSIDLGYEAGREPSRHAPELEIGMYRIVQEALGNAVKHAEAGHVGVVIREEDGRVRLVIRDDGKGFDTTIESNGFGLVGMRERADLLAGSLEVESVPGAGTTVTAVLPVTRRVSEVGPPSPRALSG